MDIMFFYIEIRPLLYSPSVTNTVDPTVPAVYPPVELPAKARDEETGYEHVYQYVSEAVQQITSQESVADPHHYINEEYSYVFNRRVGRNSSTTSSASVTNQNVHCAVIHPEVVAHNYVNTAEQPV